MPHGNAVERDGMICLLNLGKVTIFEIYSDYFVLCD